MKQEKNAQMEPRLSMAQMICKVVELLRAAEADAKRPMMLDDGTCMVRIEMEDIIRVEADRVYCHIYVLDLKKQKVEKHTISRPLCEVEKGLPSETFVRIHRSHIINLWKVRQVMHRQITLDDGTQLTMGENYKDCLNGRFWVLNKPYPK